MSTQPEPKAALPADPGMDKLLADTQGFWRETGRQMVQRSIGAADDAAKQIVGVAGILEGLYFHAIAYSTLSGKLPDATTMWIYLAPVLSLLLSLASALAVFFPGYYDLNINSWEACRTVHNWVAGRKLRLARIAAVFLVLGVAALFVAVWKYLLG